MNHFLSIGNEDPILGSTWETVPAQGGSLITKTFISDGLEEWSAEWTALACAMTQAQESTCVRAGLGEERGKWRKAMTELC